MKRAEPLTSTPGSGPYKRPASQVDVDEWPD